MSQVEYHDWRANQAEAARHGDGASAPYQLCSQCGACEYAGGFCHNHGNGNYTLIAHLHASEGGGSLTGCTPAAVVGEYRHLTSAPEARFIVAMQPQSDERLAVLARARLLARRAA
jgi:hypothetical protein